VKDVDKICISIAAITFCLTWIALELGEIRRALAKKDAPHGPTLVEAVAQALKKAEGK